MRIRPIGIRTLTAFLLALALVIAAPAPVLAASGDLDPTFGSDGVATAAFGEAAAWATALARQTDGKLVAAGSVATASGSAIAVARFDASGVLDPAFGVGGMVTTPIGSLGNWTAQVVIQSDGKIVVAGNTNVPATNDDGDVLVVRYLGDGTLDAGFGTGGTVVADLGSGNDNVGSAALQADDKIVVVAGAWSTGVAAADLSVLRYDTGGALDGSFGTSGIATLDFGGRADQGGGVLVQPDQMIVVSGASFDGPLFADGGVGTLSRLDGTGALDAGFGAGGSVLLAVDNINLFGAIVRQPDDQIVAHGATGPLNVGFRLYRYDTGGVPDGGFVGAPVPVFTTQNAPGSLALQGDGKFIVVGNGVQSRFSAARMNADGSLDTSFAIGGSIDLAVGLLGNASAALAEASGDFLLAGASRPVGSPQFGSVMTIARVQGSSAACASDADCGVCERCGGGGSCEIGARSGCAPAAPERASIALRSGYNPHLRLIWRGTTPGFDPTGSDDVGVCMFHNGRRILKAVAPAGGVCDADPCWSSDGPGKYKYADAALTPDGMRRIKIDGGGIKVIARGGELATSAQGVPDPLSLGPLSAPVVTQVQASNGACAEALFASDRRAKPRSFKAKND